MKHCVVLYMDNLLEFAKAYNTMVATDNMITISQIIERNIIPREINQSKEWVDLVENNPEVVCHFPQGPGCGRWCGDPTVCVVSFPTGWKWNYEKNTSTLQLHDNNGYTKYSKYYGPPRYSN